jgi:hypothetical protein
LVVRPCGAGGVAERTELARRACRVDNSVVAELAAALPRTA